MTWLQLQPEGRGHCLLVRVLQPVSSRNRGHQSLSEEHRPCSSELLQSNFFFMLHTRSYRKARLKIPIAIWHIFFFFSLTFGCLANGQILISLKFFYCQFPHCKICLFCWLVLAWHAHFVPSLGLLLCFPLNWYGVMMIGWTQTHESDTEINERAE